MSGVEQELQYGTAMIAAVEEVFERVSGETAGDGKGLPASTIAAGLSAMVYFVAGLARRLDDAVGNTVTIDALHGAVKAGAEAASGLPVVSVTNEDGTPFVREVVITDEPAPQEAGAAPPEDGQEVDRDVFDDVAARVHDLVQNAICDEPGPGVSVPFARVSGALLGALDGVVQATAHAVKLGAMPEEATLDGMIAFVTDAYKLSMSCPLNAVKH